MQTRVREMIVAAIAEGWLRPETPLPSSRALADCLCVARNTILLAYQQLVDEGVLESRARSGYFVCPQAKPMRPDMAGRDEPSGAGVDWSARLRAYPSRQRNIAKPREWSSYPYPFIYGQFDPAIFPANDWRECVRQALSVLEIRGWAADMIDGDDVYLIEQLRTRVLPRRGIWAGPDEVMVTLGAQQALYILAHLLVGRDDVVGIEDPGYPDARNIFRLRTPHVVPVPVDDEGAIADRIPDACSVLLLTPARHCPTGVTLSAARRASLLQLAAERDILLIEDDYESNFGLSSDAASTLRAHDPSGRVSYVGSLSKTLAPGLRLGFIVGAPDLIREARALRRLMMRHPPTNNQRAMALFLALGHFDRHLRRCVDVLTERALVMRSALAEHMDGFECRFGTGGSSAWVRGPEGFDSRRLAAGARDAGVLIEPGDVFFLDDQPPLNFFRLGFSAIPTHRIEAGIELLGRLARAAEQSSPVPERPASSGAALDAAHRAVSG
ncbi:PLP-dependent aminotransferase family protein [Arenibaculum sp.]|uniref:aminotransferase-like domain-containing protein n=1 Tax=Arenibaculum sp. TaxID=2865862 RepID=UPI002E16855A|nr:PLP-dependent aminotransferase family protein [Arenibaculum sp.]